MSQSSFGSLSGHLNTAKAHMAKVHTADDFRRILDIELPQLPDDSPQSYCAGCCGESMILQHAISGHVHI